MTLPILTADDYAMTDGVARSIETLAYARRLSATSAMTTQPEWPECALRLRVFRDRLAIGLHLNFTLGAPSGPMPRLAPDGVFLSRNALLVASLLGHLAPDEVRAEIARQFDAFETHLGFPPDHVDGHEHVHVLPVIRQGVLAELAARYPTCPPLLRNPSVAAGLLPSRGRVGVKALAVTLLAAGFGRAASTHGFVTNTRFAGYSTFDKATSYAAEIQSEIKRVSATGNALSIVMCHPGYADATPAALDRIGDRRQQEHDALLQLDALPDRIWHAARAVDGAAIDWAAVGRTR